jgi:carboxylesterase type B
LRKADISLLASANINISESGFYGTYAFLPVIDKEFIHNRPSEALAKGMVNGVRIPFLADALMFRLDFILQERLLAFTNTLEGDIFVDEQLAHVHDVAGYAQGLYPDLSDQEAAAVASTYKNVGSDLEQFAAIYADCAFNFFLVQ